MTNATSTTATATKIQALPFGDLQLVADQYKATGKIATALATEGALLPMLSNALCGHSTFSKLMAEKSVNKAHAVQVAVWGDLRTDKGSPRETKKAHLVREVFKLARVTTNQADHDASISEARMIIADHFAPVVREKADRTDWKALCAELEAKLQACQIDLAECQSELTEYKQAKRFVTRDRSMLNAALARIQSMDTVIQRMGDQSTIDKACEGLDFPTMMISLED